MSRPLTGWARQTVRATVLSLVAGLLATLSLSISGPTEARESDPANPVTPGDFTGYGFDQCLAPSQRTMNRWRRHSPFWGVGIYIAGEERACREQPNLTPRWVHTQLARGWRLLPITLGPQASCQPRFPRYPGNHTISPRPGKRGNYRPARRQGALEATQTVDAAQALGIVPGSTMYYDLEGFSLSNTRCRESALAFLSAWTTRIHELGYVSGVYSSAGSGIKMLDDARVRRPGRFDLPDQLWIARWSGVPGRINDSGHTYLRADGWQPHARVHQYQGGHNETWGRATVNIDRNFLDVGRGSIAAPESHCRGTVVSFANYPRLKPATTRYTPDQDLVRALQCLLKEHGLYKRKLNGKYDATVAAVNRWQTAHGLPVGPVWSRNAWMTLLADGDRPLLKYGSAGSDVRQIQRALNAASWRVKLQVSGVFDDETEDALRAYQGRAGLTVDGIVAGSTWAALQAGTR